MVRSRICRLTGRPMVILCAQLPARTMKTVHRVGAVLIVAVSALVAQQDVPIPTLPGPVCSKKTKQNNQPCVTRSRPILSPDPVYPERARSAGEEATVLVWLVVTEEGKPVDVRIKKSAGHDFDQAAYDCVRKWTFAPATYEGKPVPTIEEVEVHFRLR